ncbi:MAG: hypothetical protein ACM3MD_12300 [Betaproteobacteria bacterium]
MKHLITVMIVITLIIVSSATGSASTPMSDCKDSDQVCKEFEQLTEAQLPEKIIARYEANRDAKYSEDSRRYIGQAYLTLASRDGVSPEEEERCYRKALELNYAVAYMGLYFLHVQKDEEKALGFLREYVKTEPADMVPYVLLGEAELNRKHYELAETYLREAKKAAHAHSSRVDWLLFQTNYLLKNYQVATEMFESAVATGKFENELKALVSDPRFEGIEKRPEFRKYQDMLKVAKAAK